MVSADCASESSVRRRRHTFRVGDPVLEAVNGDLLASRLPNNGES
jgi:hypothetical protein